MAKRKSNGHGPTERQEPVEIQDVVVPVPPEIDDNELSAADQPDLRGIEMSRGTPPAPAEDRMAAARAARARANGPAKPRNPPTYLVLGVRQDGEHDVLKVCKSRRAAQKWFAENGGLVRRFYAGIVALRGKVWEL